MADKPKCFSCRVTMLAGVDRWTCPDCGWWQPVSGACPVCFTALPAEVNEDGCKVCPGCGHEVWPPREEYMAPSLSRQVREAWYDEQRYKRAISSPGGGGKSGRGRKKPIPRRQPWLEQFA